MLTLYEIDELALHAGVNNKELLLCAYVQGFELSPVCEKIAENLYYEEM